VDVDQLGDALRQLDAEARANTPGSAAPPPAPPEEIVANWRADEARNRLDGIPDDEQLGAHIDLLDVGVRLLARLLGK
jgi:hypothetical protein